MPLELPAFYLIDHRLIALVMVALLLAAAKSGTGSDWPTKARLTHCAR